MNRGFVLLLILLLNVSIVSAATIHGTVYNLDLNPVKNVKVELTSPKQVFIALDGTFSFNAPTGTYALTAKLIKNGTVEASASESIQVTDDNDYVLDLILFPEFDDQSELLNETDQIEIDELETFDNGTTWLRVGIGAALVIALLWFFLREKKKKHQGGDSAKETSSKQDDAKHVLDIIKEQGGRTTQKDIRKKTPLGEAKVSLIITELEHKGLIEKIKKGRGNVIVLK